MLHRVARNSKVFRGEGGVCNVSGLQQDSLCLRAVLFARVVCTKVSTDTRELYKLLKVSYLHREEWSESIQSHVENIASTLKCFAIEIVSSTTVQQFSISSRYFWNNFNFLIYSRLVFALQRHKSDLSQLGELVFVWMVIKMHARVFVCICECMCVCVGGWRKILGSKRDKKPSRKMGWNEKMRHEAFPFQTCNLISWCEVVHRNRIPNCALFVALKMQMERCGRRLNGVKRERERGRKRKSWQKNVSC